jgi:hypothetical protein
MVIALSTTLASLHPGSHTCSSSSSSNTRAFKNCQWHPAHKGEDFPWYVSSTPVTHFAGAGR